jgi:hypothetical protein
MAKNAFSESSVRLWIIFKETIGSIGSLMLIYIFFSWRNIPKADLALSTLSLPGELFLAKPDQEKKRVA